MPSYFAYGSNMSSAQMTRRVQSAVARGRGRLPDFRFCCNKLGRDGSAKGNVEVARGETVWGVVYDMDQESIDQLDRFEKGYRRVALEVIQDDGSRVVCQVYVSEQITQAARPLSQYRQRMAEGAAEHNLPPAVVDALRTLEVQD